MLFCSITIDYNRHFEEALTVLVFQSTNFCCNERRSSLSGLRT